MPLIRKDTGPAEPPPTAAAGLGAPDPDRRWEVARALRGQPGASAALGAALSVETDPRVREALLTSLASAPDDEGVVAIASCLRSDEAALRTGALDALRACGPRVAAVMPMLLADADPDVRGLSLDLVRQLPAGEASALLAEVLDAEADPNVCAAAVDVLAETGGAGDAGALARCAARFPNQPFLAFAIRIALDRIAAAAPGPA